jgi:beta-lactamase class A
MELLRQAHEGTINLADPHWVTSDHQVAGSGILSEIGDHTTQMSVEDLAVLMIVLSDNTATNMLIDLVGMENVTAMMARLGCEHTRLQRRMMDTAASARGEENLSTPADAARLLRLLYEGEFVNREVSDHALAILRKPKTGVVNSVTPPGVVVAFKPGSIPGVETEWALVELEGRPYIITMMGAYDQGGELKTALREAASAAQEFFSRLATGTKYGAYIDPEEWAKH